ncbi:MAG TPA: hypothetical protein VJZ00_12895 [Thermoanaerobaculia bacterium]|nr:hypothetical protein [Thermoanaerobaculia bacterium]
MTRARTLIVYACAAALTAMLVRALYFRGGPYLEVPRTVFDHAGPDALLPRQAIVMCRHVEPLMPRGASVTVIDPQEAPNYDPTLYLTASGFLPRHRVLHPSLDEGQPWPDFVIALAHPLVHRGYRLVREFPEGRLYGAVR